MQESFSAACIAVPFLHMPPTKTAPDVIAALRRLPLFTDLSEEQLNGVAAQAALRHYEPPQTIFAEGDACQELFIVKEGSVRIFKTAANGREQLLSIERAGSSLSEIPVFDNDCYPVSAEAVTQTVLIRLDAAAFRGICLQQPDVALKVIKVLAHRLRRMGSLVEDLSFTTVRGRLITHLLQLAQSKSRESSSAIEFTLSENNEELASRLGTVRELISRNMGRLHNEGLIHIQRRKVAVPNLKALQAEIDRDK
jgi:CRP-like cAMP-binding protein